MLHPSGREIGPGKAVLLALALATLPSLPLQAQGSRYQALCNDAPCTIVLDAKGIAGPNVFIPMNRVSQWFTGGQEHYDKASGAAGAVGAGTLGAVAGGALLGPIGLVGGLVGAGLAGSQLGKSADLYFTVIGHDDMGEKTSLSFRFVNPRPATKMKTELPLFTGLSMGQTRDSHGLDAPMSQGSSPQPLPGGAVSQPLPSY
jgi:hypothetical protein